MRKKYILQFYSRLSMRLKGSEVNSRVKLFNIYFRNIIFPTTINFNFERERINFPNFFCFFITYNFFTEWRNYSPWWFLNFKSYPPNKSISKDRKKIVCSMHHCHGCFLAYLFLLLSFSVLPTMTKSFRIRWSGRRINTASA